MNTPRSFGDIAATSNTQDPLRRIRLIAQSKPDGSPPEIPFITDMDAATKTVKVFGEIVNIEPGSIAPTWQRPYHEARDELAERVFSLSGRQGASSGFNMNFWGDGRKVSYIQLSLSREDEKEYSVNRQDYWIGKAKMTIYPMEQTDLTDSPTRPISFWANVILDSTNTGSVKLNFSTLDAIHGTARMDDVREELDTIGLHGWTMEVRGTAARPVHREAIVVGWYQDDHSDEVKALESAANASASFDADPAGTIRLSIVEGLVHLDDSAWTRIEADLTSLARTEGSGVYLASELYNKLDLPLPSVLSQG